MSTIDDFVDDVARSVEIEDVGAPYRLGLRNGRHAEILTRLDEWRPATPPSIPRMLHQIWIGPHEPPWPWIDTFRHEFANEFPTWEYRLWRDADLDALPMHNREWYERESALAGRADIARYEILLRDGGVYVDADIAWLNGRPLDDLRYLTGDGLFAGWEDREMLANSLIGSTPGNPTLRYVVRSLHHTYPASRLERGWPPWIATGPRYFSEAVRDLPMTRFPTGWFYPVSWHDPPQHVDAAAFPNAYTVHYGYSTNGHAPPDSPPDSPPHEDG